MSVDVLSRVVPTHPVVQRAKGDVKKVVITGGSGMLGLRIAYAFILAGAREIISIDPCGCPSEDYFAKTFTPMPLLLRHVKFVRASVCDAVALRSALIGADVVCHLASYGMSGPERLQRKNVMNINVDATAKLLSLAQEAGVKAFVYASSYNAVFYGQRISGAGLDDIPYPPESCFLDNYSLSKCRAEKLVRAANGIGSGGDRMHTAALRLAGLYGEGEMRHFSRIVSEIEKGIMRFTIGGTKILVEWLHADNCAFAFVLAAARLIEERRSPPQSGSPHHTVLVSGGAFPISDCRPINQFEMLFPLVEQLGRALPFINIPTGVAVFFAYLQEVIYHIANAVGVRFTPYLSRCDIFKIGVEHYFDSLRAVQNLVLGYYPIVKFEEGLARMYAQLVADAKRRKEAKARAKPSWMLAAWVRLFLALAALIALYCSPFFI